MKRRGASHRRIQLQMSAQPDAFTCGPTCLHALYNFYHDALDLETTIREVRRLDHGGTLAVLLAIHALKRGYHAKMHSYNLHVFDPTWFHLSPGEIHRRMSARLEARPEYRHIIGAYMEFLELGGVLDFEELTPALIRRYLSRGVPVLTGLSSTYLYRSAREAGPDDHDDDVAGDPQGHFVILTGYDKRDRSVMIADPMEDNPAFQSRAYAVGINRLICSILLGIITNDAVLLVIQPDHPDHPGAKTTSLYVDAHRRQ